MGQKGAHCRTLAPSVAGNGSRSTSVILVFLNRALVLSSKAVDSPNAPDPIIRIDLGALNDRAGLSILIVIE